MLLKHVAVSVVTIALAIVVSSACSGGGKSCTSLCTEAQAGKCTVVKGDCTKFCAALDAVKGPANCNTQYGSYQTCLSAKPKVCDATCNSEETALGNCVTPYCTSHLLDPNCQTLATSF